MQEHPTSKGVFRANFRDDRRISINPDGEKHISFGFELQGVDAGEHRLILGKGSQTIEITDRGAANGALAEEVVWPDEAPVPLAAPAYAAPPAGVGGAALLAIGGIGLVFGLIVAGGAISGSDMGAAFCLMGVGMLFLLVGLGLYFVGRARFMRGEHATLSFPLSSAIGRKVRYDTNLGCLLMLVLTPVIGPIVMLAMGRRIVRMTVPNDRGQRPAHQMLELKVASSAEGAILDAALRG